LEKGPIGIREVQKSMGFSSPSTAVYHLERLKSRGMVDKNANGSYYAVKSSRPGVLRFYALFGRRLLPRSLIYSILLPIVELVVLHLSNYRLEITLALIPAFFATLIFWYETFDLLRFKKDLFKKRSNFRMDDSKA
jgi:hypothetical protein